MNTLMNDFNQIGSEAEAWYYFISITLCGILLGMILFMILSGKRNTYYHGQIDAIRGIIKWKLERNEEGEEVWTEIKQTKNKIE